MNLKESATKGLPFRYNLVKGANSAFFLSRNNDILVCPYGPLNHCSSMCPQFDVEVTAEYEKYEPHMTPTDIPRSVVANLTCGVGRSYPIQSIHGIESAPAEA